jgi:hypothetical protein
MAMTATQAVESKKGASVSEKGFRARQKPEAAMQRMALWKTTWREIPCGLASSATHVCTSCSIVNAEMYITRHGRRALKIVGTPRTRPICSGLRIHNTPTNVVMDSVRTADTAKGGKNQHETTLLTAQELVASTVWMPTRYRPADEKSISLASWLK